MKLSYLLIVSAVIYAIFGIGFLLVPGPVLSLYGGMSMEPFTEQLFGAFLIGFAVLNWFARNATEGQALRAIVLANLVTNTISFIAALLQQLSGVVNMLGWSTVVISLLERIPVWFTTVGVEPLGGFRLKPRVRIVNQLGICSSGAGLCVFSV